jgi:hypothetical protein
MVRVVYQFGGFGRFENIPNTEFGEMGKESTEID